MGKMKRIDCEGVGDNNGFYEMTAEAGKTEQDSNSELNLLLSATQLVESFVSDLINNHEGAVITEEYLHAVFADFIKRNNLVEYAGR